MSQVLPIVLITAAIAAGVGATTGMLVGRAPARAEGPGADEALTRMADAVAELVARQDSLDRSIDELRAAGTLVAPAGDSRVDVGEIEAAVARYLERGGAPAAGAEPSAEAAQPEGERLAEVLAVLESGELDDLQVQALWRELADEGLTAEVVAAFERRAEENPNDPDVQVELGGIYLNKIFEVGNSPEAGLWATKADNAFDRALELDEQHWDARFHKAVSLSFWPPVFGKQGEAIQHFEVLVAQQATSPQENHFVQTHLLLGNMYQQIGEHEKALGAWNNGLQAFPGNEELLSQIQVFGGE